MPDSLDRLAPANSWLRRSPVRDGILSGIVVFLTAMIGLLWLGDKAKRDEEKLVRESLMRLASGAAGLVDGDLHQKIFQSGEMESEDYRRALDPLVKFHQGVPEAAYLYTLVAKDNGLYFGLDTAVEAQRLGFNRKMEASPLREPFHSNSPAEDAAEIAAIRAGRTYISPAPVTDEYGTFLTALAPVRDSHGKPVAALGVDLSVDEYLARLARLLQYKYMSIAAVAFSSLLVGLVVWNTRRRSLEHESETQQARAGMTQLEERDRRLVKALGQIIYEHHFPEDEIVWGGDFQTILGYLPSEMSRNTETWLDAVHPDDRAAVKAGFDKVFAYGGVFDAEYRYRRTDGSYAWFRDRGVVSGEGIKKRIDGVLIDVTQRRISDERFRTVFESSSDPHMLVDQEGVIDCNLATVELLGYKDKGDIIRQPLAKFWPEFQPNGQRTEDYLKEMLLATKPKRAHRFEAVKKHAGGELIPVEVSFTRITLQGRSVMLVIWHDLRQIKQVQGDLIVAKESAEAAGRAKSEFLAIMSHEIRTPMNGLIGFTQLLDETSLSEQQRDYVGTIRSCADSLLHMLNDILDFSKMESGHFQTERRPLSLRHTVGDVVTFHFPHAMVKGIMLRATYVEGMDDWILSDNIRFRQVLMNLLGNAIKFTERGEIEVRVSSLDEDGRHFVQVEVRDTGIGIAPEKLADLFKPFSQVDSSATRKYGGAGLGLAICLRLVELMGGTLQVSSEPRKGSTFTFRLPVEAIASSEMIHPLPATAEAALARASAQNFRILVAEDVPINRKVISHMLRSIGYSADMVTNGQECLDVCATTDYDLIFMDVQMPELDGFETTRRLRAAGKNAWIVALTAAAMPDDQQRCAAAGMNDYMTKPVTKAQLRAVIDRAIAAHPSPRQ